MIAQRGRPRLRAGRPPATAVLLLIAAIAGCGGERRGAPESRAPEPESPAPVAPDLRASTIYWSDRQAERVVPVTRYLDPDSGLARGAVLALLAGPDAEEGARGLGTAVPAGTRLLGLTVRDSVATVDLSRTFESGAGSASILMRVAQLVHTLVRVPGVARVRLWLDGRPVSTFSAEGLELAETLVPGDFPDLAPYDADPPVVITAPVPGSAAGDSVIVRGTANVFEAHVGLRVRDASGRVLIETWTTATCGTGCRGTFEKAIALPDSLQGDFTVEAFAPSAKDGSDMHRVRNRVRRLPA